MIPEQMSREELIRTVIDNCAECSKDCPPFKKGEFYPVYQDALDITVLPDGDDADAISFTYEEMSEYFVPIDYEIESTPHKPSNIVRIVQNSIKYNPHIKNRGELAVVEEEGEDWLQIRTESGGMGAIDKNTVVYLHPHTLTNEQRVRLEIKP